MVEIITKASNCGINAEKQIDSKEQDSTKQAAEPRSNPVILEVLSRNKPILDVLSVSCFIFIVASIGLLACVLVLYGRSSTNRSSDKHNELETSLKIVTRIEWLAQPPRERLNLLQRPVHQIIIAHTDIGHCSTQSECVAQVRRIQSFHMASKNFADISYNFLVGGDGNVYEGRGWDTQGSHTRGFNGDSIGIAFIGTFYNIEAPECQLNATQQLIVEGVRLGKVDPGYRLFGHQQLAPLESPGRVLYEQIKKLPHWSRELGPRY